MSKQLLSKVRQSASLILFAKSKGEAVTSYDYNVLLFTRTSKSSFMPDSSVFPGGVCDAADSAPSWLAHFERYDVSARKLRDFLSRKAGGPASNGIDSIDTALSLRLTAIRETFEEMGILLCRDLKTFSNTSGYGQFHEQFDVTHWQKEVHNDANKFLTLCKELEVIPDIWSLHDWSAWRTPSTFTKRFQTAFFLTALEAKPSLHVEPIEVKDYAWRSPLEYLQRALAKQLWLPPPQFYELSRCLNFKTLETLREFAEKRADKGVVLFHPVLFKCSDGWVQLLPGDEMYPANPDASSEKIETGLSIAEFRAQVQEYKPLHRTEHKNQHESQLLINFEPADGQVQPIDARKLL